jgi:hypothetical protein
LRQPSVTSPIHETENERSFRSEITSDCEQGSEDQLAYGNRPRFSFASDFGIRVLEHYGIKMQHMRKKAFIEQRTTSG